MNTQNLLDALGYKNNPAFLQGEKLEKHYGYSFFFSQASQSTDKNRGCNLKGVYRVLDSSDNSNNNSITPVVYVCEAANEDEAGKIHKRVWNQNIVPFLFVITPQNIRLYSGFDYDDDESDEQQILKKVEDVNKIFNELKEFTDDSINSGQIWEQQKISTANRVDRHLLANLEKLSEVLKGKNYDLSLEFTHSLIGKYIYLKYLRDRDILSDDRLSKFNMAAGDFLGRNAQKNKLYEIEKHLDTFLNGSVFPLPPKKDIEEKHVQKVAATFQGDDPEGGQQVLFNMYDFSCIPIETLSVVYQQFLRQKGETKEKGAYYTPVHLVNFILDELNAKKPLRRGMKVFDPSCGSGAFLVQCYRRLVESILRGKKERLNPSDLRDILTEHIFGLDADKEACQVAQLSLSLTLLDYIDPPDLTTYHNFRLPDLRESNIFYCKGGFFDEDSPWVKFIYRKKEETKRETKYNWIVGNPPWKNIDKKKNDKLSDKKAVEWIDSNKNLFPVDNYQLAEAFAWKVTELLDKEGQCGILLPAMTLFKTQGDKFRAKFFSETKVWCVVNFANIRRYLFEGAINPAAAFFFSGKKEWNKSEHYITTYAPFAVEQSLQLKQKGESKKLWSVFVNYSTIKELPLRDIVTGSAIPWKISMWGTHRDKKIIDLSFKKNITLEVFSSRSNLCISEGSQLRYLPKFNNYKEEQDFYKKHEFLSGLVGKGEIDKEKLNKYIKSSKIALQLPPNTLVGIKKSNAYLRKRGGMGGLSVSNPPHIIIAASRKRMLYSDDFVFVPPRQIGISGKPKQSNLLKSLTLYLHSDFICYQQWLTGEALGVERDCVNFESLKQMPVPLIHLPEKELLDWANLYDRIVEANKREIEKQQNENASLFDSRQKITVQSLNDLLKRMNEKVYKLLGITQKQQWLIEDMLNVRMKLNDGKIAKEATKQATEKEIKEFAKIFQDELDLFLDETGKKKVHKAKVLYTDNTAVMIIEHLQKAKAGEPEILEVKDPNTKQEFDTLQSNLTENRSQWIYYTRCLKIYDKLNRKTYIFKPRQRLYWLKSQALVEADDFLAGKIGGE